MAGLCMSRGDAGAELGQGFLVYLHCVCRAMVSFAKGGINGQTLEIVGELAVTLCALRTD